MSDDQSITARMRAIIEEFEKVSDRRAIFLNCYMLMTQNMLTAVEAGQFTDPFWVSTLLDRFADYYFEGLSRYELNTDPTSAVWHIAHRAASVPQTLVLQNLLLGINAHINYDLVLTLVELLEPEWQQLSADQRQIRQSDFFQVNEIIKNTIDTVQDDVVERYSPKMDLVDKVFGSLDEWLISRLIINWRDEVWAEAVEMINTADENERHQLVIHIEALTLKRADAILFKIWPPN